MTPNPWFELPEEPDFVLPSDQPMVADHNARRKSEHRFHLEALPEPFLGSVDAPVVLLNLNPGFHRSDLTNYAVRERASIMRRSLVHDLSPDQAFYFLSEPFRGTGGWNWWQKKLGPLIKRVGLDRVRRGVQVIEYVPYKSEKFYGFNGTLPSQAYSFYMAEQAVRRRASVVAMRSARFWLSMVPSLVGHETHVLNSAQNVTISPKNCPTGFDQVVERLLQIA